MGDQIRVLPDDVERDSHTGKHSNYRYRRFHIRSIDAWGVARYSRVLEFAGRDCQVRIASFLEDQLAGMNDSVARHWVKANSPIHVPMMDEG